MMSKFIARILLMSLFGIFLQIIPTPAQAAALTDYGLNYKTAYFNVSGGLAPKAAMGAKWVGVSYRIDGFKK